MNYITLTENNNKILQLDLNKECVIIPKEVVRFHVKKLFSMKQEAPTSLSGSSSLRLLMRSIVQIRFGYKLEISS